MSDDTLGIILMLLLGSIPIVMSIVLNLKRDDR